MLEAWNRIGYWGFSLYQFALSLQHPVFLNRYSCVIAWFVVLCSISISYELSLYIIGYEEGTSRYERVPTGKHIPSSHLHVWGLQALLIYLYLCHWRKQVRCPKNQFIYSVLFSSFEWLYTQLY